MAEHRKLSSFVRESAFYFLLALVGLLMVFPILWTVSNSLKVTSAIFTLPPQLIPRPVALENYVNVWKEVSVFQYMFNTAFIVFCIIVGGIFSNSFIGFGFAKVRFKGQEIIFFAALATLMLPGTVTIVPEYIIWSKLSLLDTYAPLILPHCFGMAFGLFLFRQFYLSMPDELYQSAVVDGCNPFVIYLKIYFPLATSVMAALSIFLFMEGWSGIYRPLIFIGSRSKYTLALGMMYIRGLYQIDQRQNMLAVTSIIMIIPVVIVFLSAQKYFIQGIATTGLKG